MEGPVQFGTVAALGNNENSKSCKNVIKYFKRELECFVFQCQNCEESLVLRGLGTVLD